MSSSLKKCMYLFSFLTHQVRVLWVQTVLDLYVWMMMTLNSWCSCLCLPSARTTCKLCYRAQTNYLIVVLRFLSLILRTLIPNILSMLLSFIFCTFIMSSKNKARGSSTTNSIENTNIKIQVLVHFVLRTYIPGILNTLTLTILLRATLLTEGAAPSEAMPTPRSLCKPQLMDYQHTPRIHLAWLQHSLLPLSPDPTQPPAEAPCSTRGHVSMQIPRGHICTQKPIEPPNKPEVAPASKAQPST